MVYLLGIDVGTGGTRAVVCDARGRVVAGASAGHASSSPQPGWSEQEPGHWWAAACRATRAAVKKAGVKRGAIAAVGLTGQMHGAVFLGEGARPLRPAILWNDQRTTAECAEIERSAGGRAALVRMVGNPAMTGFMAPKILWVRKNEPRVYERTRHVLLPKDYVRYRMTGEYATDVGDASGTLLLDVRRRAWSGRMLSILGIDRAWLPRVYESQEATGTLTRAAAASMGLDAGIAVVAGSGDQPAGAVGNGVVAPGIVGATIGTSGVVFAHTAKPVFDPLGRVHTMCSAVAGEWCVFGCMLSAGGSLQWFRNQIGSAEMTEGRRRGVDPYELLIKEAARVPAGCDGLFFLPYLTGERCPHADPKARGGWIGLTSRHTRAHLVRAVIEGVTYGMADILEAMKGMGVAVKRLRLSGGGARSPLWRQMQADVYVRPVAVTNAEEGAAFGAAILAGVGAGIWPTVPRACAAVIREKERLTPNRKNVAIYARGHRQYRRLYPALKEEFPRLA